MDRAKVRGLYQCEAVIDNNIICDFCELDRLDILNKVFSKILIAKSIIDTEVIQHKDRLPEIIYEEAYIEGFEGYSFMKKILQDHGGLTECDAEVVTIAYEKYVLCTSNEKRIKTTCDENDIKYTGTLGVLSCAYEHDILTQLEFCALIDKLEHECTSFIARALFNDVRRTYELI